MRILVFSFALLLTFNSIAQEDEIDSTALIAPEDMDFNIAFCEGSWIQLSNGVENTNTFGFLGITLGIDYYLRPDYAFNTSFTGLFNFGIEDGEILEESGLKTALAGALSFQMVKSYNNNWSISGGLQINRTSYSFYSDDLVEDGFYRYRQTQLGLAAGVNYNWDNTVKIHLRYYPSFMENIPGKFEMGYSHLLVVETAISLPIRKKYKESEEDDFE